MKSSFAHINKGFQIHDWGTNHVLKGRKFMKKISAIILVLLCSTTLSYAADTRFLLKGSDGMNLANILLKAETQKCLQTVGFKGVDILTNARKAMIDETGSATIYSLTIDEYENLPSDGKRLVAVKELTINATEVLTRGGKITNITCSFETPNEG